MVFLNYHQFTSSFCLSYILLYTSTNLNFISPLVSSVDKKTEKKKEVKIDLPNFVHK